MRSWLWCLGVACGAPLVPVLSPSPPTSVPVMGGTLAIDADRVVVSDPHRDLVAELDRSSGQFVAHHQFDAGTVPFRVALAPGRAWVILRGTGEVARLDAGALVERRSVCRHPRGIDVADGEVWIACAGGTLHHLDEDLYEVSRRFVAPDLRDVVIDEGTVWVSTFRRAAQWPVDRSTGAVGPAVTPEVAGDAVPTAGWRMVAHPGGGTLLLHQASSRAPVAAHRNGSGVRYGGGPLCGRDEDPNPTVSVQLTRVHADGSAEPARPVGGIGLAVDVAVDASGELVSLVAGLPGEPGGWGQFLVGPKWQVDSCIPAELVATFRGPATSVATIGEDWRPWVFASGEAVIAWDGLDVALPAGPLELPDAAAIERFHGDPGAGVSCASCHPEAQDDAHTWRFEDGRVRRTQNLAGGMTARGALHWQGEHATFAALMDEVFSAGMVGGPVALADVHALERWLDGIEPVERAVTAPARTLTLGASRFRDAGCATCHAGPALSDHRLHAVFSDGPATKTPSLRGVGTRAGLMHDGCAVDVLDRLTRPSCGGDQHGDTAGWPIGDLEALAAYVETL